MIPGVRSACCGHGVQRGFIAFKNGVVVRGMFDEIESACCGHGVQRGFIAFKNGVVVRGMFDEIEHLNAAELARLFVVTMG